MGRRKHGNPVTGWLVLDKAYDVGSTEAVSKAKWLFNAQKAGHAGTLDPLATGILPIAFGEATKTVSYIQDAEKTYRFTARWGTQTATDDREGDVVGSSDHRPSRDDILRVLPNFTGLIEQRPPAFSAIKVGGERAYDLAREGRDVEIPLREVSILRLSLIDIPSNDEAVFEAQTSKGTYVRSLVRDLAQALGTVGHVSALRRTAVGPFNEGMAVAFSDMTGVPDTDKLGPEHRDGSYGKFLVGIEGAMVTAPKVGIGRPEALRLAHGGDVVLGLPHVAPIRRGNPDDIEPVLVVEGDRPVALCRLEGLKLRPLKVFNTAA